MLSVLWFGLRGVGGHFGATKVGQDVAMQHSRVEGSNALFVGLEIRDKMHGVYTLNVTK